MKYAFDSIKYLNDITISESLQPSYYFFIPAIQNQYKEMRYWVQSITHELHFLRFSTRSFIENYSPIQENFPQ